MIQIFTFGFGHAHPNGYVEIEADTPMEARLKMVERFENKWAFQYDSKEKAGVDRFNLYNIDDPIPEATDEAPYDGDNLFDFPEWL